MKTNYSDIVNVNAIGKAENPISLNDILKMANDEQLTPSKQNKERVLFIGIDVQQDLNITHCVITIIANMFDSVV